MKNRAQPTDGNERARGRAREIPRQGGERREQRVLRGAEIGGAQRHQERHECRLTHAADHGVERGGEHEQPHFLAREREPHVEQIGERLADAEYQQRAERAPAHVHPAAEGHADHGRDGHVELAGDAELIQGESHAAQHERAVEAQARAHRPPCRAAPAAGIPTCHFLAEQFAATDATPHRPGCGADGRALAAPAPRTSRTRWRP